MKLPVFAFPSEQRIFGCSLALPGLSTSQARILRPCHDPDRLYPSAAQCKDDPSIAVLPFWMIPGMGLQARWPSLQKVDARERRVAVSTGIEGSPKKKKQGIPHHRNVTRPREMRAHGFLASLLAPLPSKCIHIAFLIIISAA
jgi:hypothetical protein